ncbi:MAG: lysophospholipid acyltransferase family protein [Pseudomonadota bacterium]
MLRSILFVIWIYATMAVLAFAFLPGMLLSRRFAVWSVKFWMRNVRWSLRVIAGIETEIRGVENIPEGPIIWASKHQSMYDAFVPWFVLPHPAIVIKRELLWYPMFGWYAMRTDMIAIKRSGGSKTLRAMVDASKKRMEKDKGRQLLIFPEGTRVAPGAPPQYKSGVFGMYHGLNVPVVPVANNIGLCWPAHGIRRRPGKVVVEILPPIAPGLAKTEFMDRLENTIEPACERLLDEGLALQGRTRADLKMEPA